MNELLGLNLPIKIITQSNIKFEGENIRNSEIYNVVIDSNYVLLSGLIPEYYDYIILQINDRKSGKNIEESLDSLHKYIIINEGEYSGANTICTESDSLLGIDFYSIFENPPDFLNKNKFLLVSNSFNIFGLLGWIGNLVNDILSLIGANSGYTLGFESVESISIDYYNYVPGIIFLPLVESIPSSAIPLSGITNKDEYIGVISKVGELYALRNGKLIDTNVNVFDISIVCKYFDYVKKITYFIFENFAIALFNDTLEKINFGNIDCSYFGGTIGEYFLINSNLYDINMNPIIGPEIAQNSGIMFCYNNIGYAYSLDGLFNFQRFVLIDGQWEVSDILDSPQSLKDYAAMTSISAGLIFERNGMLSLAFLIPNTNYELIVYNLSGSPLEELSFPIITAGKICGC